MGPSNSNQPPLITALGIAVLVVALVGTQFLDWEWGSGQLVPSLIGVGVVGFIALRYLRRTTE